VRLLTFAARCEIAVEIRLSYNAPLLPSDVGSPDSTDE
jgi:hypothetical protein